MELKRLISHFTYKIEPKPGGGYIARVSDPSVPPIEAATRHELQQKIQANISSVLTENVPALKLSPEIESKVAETVVGVLCKQITPEPDNALAAQAGSGDVQVVVNRKVSFSAGKFGSSNPRFRAADNPQAANLLNARNTPITPESSMLSPVVLILAVLILFAIFFFRLR